MKKSGTLSFKSDGPCPRAHPWKALKTRKYLFYLESMHLQWTEYFAKLFTGIKKGAQGCTRAIQGFAESTTQNENFTNFRDPEISIGVPDSASTPQLSESAHLRHK